MNSEKPVVSISLLCSGRSETTKKCLDSLNSLREKVPSELIIVDTGCNEEMKELLRTYTDHILPFKWCNDFSAARNVGLEAAKGEWFLYLDDDEWFHDTKEIEDFFLSGEYKDYHYALYIQRNYLSLNKELKTDAWVSRMIRLSDKPKFVSSIHEYFYPMYDPCKMLHSYVEHFGYCFKNKEEERRHAKRNIVLLLDMIKKRRREVRWWTHLLQEYRATDEYGKLEELCLEGLKEFSNDGTPNTNRERGAFYCALLEAEVRTLFYEKAEENLRKALADKRNTDYCRMRLYNIGQEIYYKLERYEDSLKCGEKYLEYYERMKDDEVKLQDEWAFFVLFAMDQSGISSGYCFYILAALKLGDTSVLKKYFHVFNWSGPIMLYEHFTHDLIYGLSEIPYDPEIPPLVEKMARRPGFTQLWNAIRSLEEESKNSAEQEERFYRISRIFMDVEAPYYYVWCLKILYADHTGETDGLPYYFERLIGCIADVFQLDEKILEIGERNGIPLWEEFSKITFDNWKIGVDTFFENSVLGKKKKMIEFANRIKPETMTEKMSIRYEYFSIKASEALIVQHYADDSFFDMQERFRVFTERSLAFYRRYFKDSAFTGEMELLPKSCRVAVKWEKIIQAQIAENRTEAGRLLKECIGLFPDFDDAIYLYIRCYATSEKIKLAEKAEEEKKANEQISAEMQTLAKQVKAKIPQLLEQGMASQAYQVLLQLQALVPGDTDLPELEKQIVSKM